MGELSSVWKATKYLIFLFNLLFWLLGLALIIVGAIALDKYGSVFTLASSDGYHWASGPALIIAIGSIVFVVAFLGCFGAIRESKCLLYTFALVLFLLFLVTLTACILVAVYKNQIEDDLLDIMFKSMKKYKSDSDVGDAWDSLQKNWPQCCGTYDYSDWWMHGDFQQGHMPQSCCTNGGDGGNCTIDDLDVVRKDACYNETIGAITDHWPIAGGIAGGVTAIQLIGSLMACGLANALSSNKYEVV